MDDQVERHPPIKPDPDHGDTERNFQADQENHDDELVEISEMEYEQVRGRRRDLETNKRKEIENDIEQKDTGNSELLQLLNYELELSQSSAQEQALPTPDNSNSKMSSAVSRRSKSASKTI